MALKKSRRMDRVICKMIGTDTYVSMDELYLSDGPPYTKAPRYTAEMKAATGLLNIIRTQYPHYIVEMKWPGGHTNSRWEVRISGKGVYNKATGKELSLAISEAFIKTFKEKAE